jgi:drug/metabolite transporter (DMT)-like permease
MPRLTFLSHFVICLAVASAAYFAAINGVPQTIWADDVSRMTSVIAVLFVGASIYLGWQAWLADDRRQPSSDFGHLAERLSVMAGFVGTAIGLSLQAKALAGGSTSFTALATSLFTTACGGVAAALLAVMTFNLEAGIRRARMAKQRVANRT